MPQVNGQHYRSAGQGYAAEKAKMGGSMGGEKHEDAPAMDGESNGQGSVMHVKHHGGGKFSTKDDSGQVTKHESPDEMHSHMMSHFGVSGSSEQQMPEDESSEYEMGDGGEALKSILG